jgi:nucleoside-diphosphate-sugar epimerase
MSGALIATGTRGFLGRHLLQAAPDGAVVPLSVRAGDAVAARLDAALAGGAADAVLHLGGRAHRADAADPAALELYRRENRDLTLALARAALARGIRRFVFVSTVGVHGLSSGAGRFAPDHAPQPASAYAQAKLEAEAGLRALADEGLEPVVVRPPLVCGVGAPGNLARLAGAVRHGLPLPLGAIRNRRSLVAAADLAELLLLAARHPAALGRVFLPADPQPLSTPELIRALARGLGRPARLVPVPPRLLRLGGRLTGRARLIEQLVDSLEVDPSSAFERLGWRPRQGAPAALAAFGAAFGTASAAETGPDR